MLLRANGAAVVPKPKRLSLTLMLQGLRATGKWTSETAAK